jgi:protein-tyrosine-phosphatase
MAEQSYNVLFLCTGNSARSIIAEALVERWGEGGFRGYSAGSHPKGAVHPLALQVLAEAEVSAAGLASKSWQVYGCPDAPRMDFVITVCDEAARETCPSWPGNPVTATWGLPDPAAVEGSAEMQLRAFRKTLQILERRVQMLVVQRFSNADRPKIERALATIGTYFPSEPPTLPQRSTP